VKSNTLRRKAVSLAVAGLSSCGSQFADPITAELATPSRDSCLRWTTYADCQLDTLNGCSFQPNTVGCLSTDPKCATGQCRGGVRLVSRIAQTLWLHDGPYRFVGAVSWGVAGWGQMCSYGALGSHDAVVTQTFDDMATMRANVLRVWAFQSYVSENGEAFDFSRFDRVIAGARRAGVRLIPVLENYWKDCTEGGQKTDAWFSTGYTLPYGAYGVSYRDYVKTITERYRDEPTILGWEMMHEAQGTDFSALYGFAADMTQVIRATGDQHLIMLGTDAGDSAATSISANTDGTPSNFEKLHAVSGIDLIDVHDFDSPTVTLANGFAAQSAVSTSLQKPLFFGASAIRLPSTSVSDYSTRAGIILAKLVASRDGGAVGFLVYDYAPGWSTVGWSFDGRAEEPISGPNGVIARNFSPNP